ncbi:hypothetical protein J7W19_00150 [Streptomyces mobaraensis NBRC 13819 = DSM 40847]|uniref:Uncharacterized protein n=1 Tax=Streptomyces mobaraensis (strain ATCC 29032 / DSM 40847 / JCM 4168 / NBRC 13819 / NCIMB 11159 / IPCR 16-22) TaxID=1223523 RepID=M2ZXL5_STRM1|nr:hypothetical protein [Streptomyces mobaraensis]EME97478.1 hypothetical protein H340_26184 [Streptomyces mobaraensis NBRC 13819 = DSM 40847]QTT72051.1 hypothetical protein J7W19_00150 [Streptomyces mobaraensis NBRC 13819 = DSM 40847]
MPDRSHGRGRTGLIRFIGNVIDDAKEFTDECLDRMRDVEHDLRKTVSDNVRPGRDADEPDASTAATTVRATAGRSRRAHG